MSGVKDPRAEASAQAVKLVSIRIKVAPSTTNSKVVTCFGVVSVNNPNPFFEVTVGVNQFTVRRTDSNGGWTQTLDMIGKYDPRRRPLHNVQDEKLKSQLFYRDIAHSERKALGHFMRFVWGGEARVRRIQTMLSHPSIADNILLTRGVCEQVLIALNFTEPTLQSLFTVIRDTQGHGARFVSSQRKWQKLQKLDPTRYIAKTSRRSWPEIEKDTYIINRLLPEVNKNQGSLRPTIRKILYVDDSPETANLRAISEEKRQNIMCVPLEHELTSGLTNTNNEQKVASMMSFLNSCEPKSVMSVWDFDCTLSACHLYKTWQHAKGHKTTERWKQEMDAWSLSVLQKHTPSIVKGALDKRLELNWETQLA